MNTSWRGGTYVLVIRTIPTYTLKFEIYKIKTYDDNN